MLLNNMFMICMAIFQVMIKHNYPKQTAPNISSLRRSVAIIYVFSYKNDDTLNSV
jgi:hypothetical protein